MNPDLVADQAKIAAFFNELEIGQDDPSDLELLVEAERRGLLDQICTRMLAEARKRQLVPPRTDLASERGDMPVRCLGWATLPSSLGRSAQSKAVTDEVARLSQDEGTQGELHISAEGIRYYEGHVKDEPDWWHPISSLQICATYNKILTTVVHAAVTGPGRAPNESTVYAYKCKDRKKALEAAELLNRICVQAQADRANPVQFSRHLAPVKTVTLVRGADGYGFNFIGPNTVADSLTGLFVTKVREGTPAAACRDVREGMQILAINGVDTDEATMAECRSLLKAAADRAVLVLQDNPLGYAAYQARAGISRPTLKYKGTDGAHELDHQLDKLAADLESLSTDMAFHPPVRTVAGHAVFF